jgi:acyl transferase domain-containing protein
VSERLDIAIVGFGGVFPGAEGPREFWKNIEQGIDAAEDVPADRWFVDPDDAYSPEVPSADRVYARRATRLRND